MSTLRWEDVRDLLDPDLGAAAGRMGRGHDRRELAGGARTGAGRGASAADGRVKPSSAPAGARWAAIAGSGPVTESKSASSCAFSMGRGPGFDCVQHRLNRRPRALRAGAHQVRGVVGAAALPGRAGHVCRDRLNQPAVGGGTHQAHPGGPGLLRMRYTRLGADGCDLAATTFQCRSAYDAGYDQEPPRR